MVVPRQLLLIWSEFVQIIDMWEGVRVLVDKLLEKVKQEGEGREVCTAPGGHTGRGDGWVQGEQGGHCMWGGTRSASRHWRSGWTGPTCWWGCCAACCVRGLGWGILGGGGCSSWSGWRRLRGRGILVEIFTEREI